MNEGYPVRSLIRHINRTGDSELTCPQCDSVGFWGPPTTRPITDAKDGLYCDHGTVGVRLFCSCCGHTTEVRFGIHKGWLRVKAVREPLHPGHRRFNRDELDCVERDERAGEVHRLIGLLKAPDAPLWSELRRRADIDFRESGGSLDEHVKCVYAKALEDALRYIDDIGQCPTETPKNPS